MKDPVKDRLKRYGLFTKLGSHLFFPTLGQAVDAYVETHQVDWADWDESTQSRAVSGGPSAPAPK